MPDWAALIYYLSIFGLLIGAGLGLPIPEEIPIVTAGWAVGHASEPIKPKVEVPGELQTVFLSSPQGGFPGNVPWPLVMVLGGDLTVPTIIIEDRAGAKTNSNPLPRSLRWYIMLPVCILGAVLADGLLYGIGRLGGPPLLKKPWVVRLLPEPKRQHIEENFHKYGVLVLVFARFLPTIRSPIFIMAGIMRVPFLRFLLADGLAGCFGVSVLFTLAYWFGDSFRDLVFRATGTVDKIKPLLILLAITAIGSYLVLHFLRHPVATGDPGEELPLLGEKVASKIEKPLFPESLKKGDKSRSADGGPGNLPSVPPVPDSTKESSK